MKITLRKRLKWIVALVVAFISVAAVSCGILLYWWSVSSSEIAKLNATNYFYDPPGGCISVEVLDRLYLRRYFEIPDVAEEITITSEISNFGSCYIIVSFSLPESQLDRFIRGAWIHRLSLSHPSAWFWYGASVAGWPLIEGREYLRGRRSDEFVDMVYEQGVVYIVVSLSL